MRVVGQPNPYARGNSSGNPFLRNNDSFAQKPKRKRRVYKPLKQKAKDVLIKSMVITKMKQLTKENRDKLEISNKTIKRTRNYKPLKNDLSKSLPKKFKKLLKRCIDKDEYIKKDEIGKSKVF